MLINLNLAPRVSSCAGRYAEGYMSLPTEGFRSLVRGMTDPYPRIRAEPSETRSGLRR